jgi:hypothetical protein
MMRVLNYILLTFAVLSCQHYNVKKEPKEQWQQVIAYAKKHLENTGHLVQKNDGYAYLKVSDDYIHKLFPLLHAKDGFRKPPYFRRPDAPGAHISVAYSDENVRFTEVGKSFNFTVKNVEEVVVNKSTTYIVLQVEARELEQLRKSYKLKPKLRGHEFHITLAKKDEPAAVAR